MDHAAHDAPEPEGHGVLRLFPLPAVELDVEEVYSDLDLPGDSRGRPYTVINAVGSLDGRGAVGGRSTPLGSETDHRLMRNIRACFDAVAVGAGTVRNEDLTLTVGERLAERREGRGLSAQPLPVLLAGRGDLPVGRRIFRGGATAGGPVVFTGSPLAARTAAALSGHATVILREAGGGDLPDPKEVVEALAAEFGVRRLLLEGGPRVNRSFAEDGLVDEIFLTIAPKLVGGNGPGTLLDGAPLTPPEPPRACLISAHLSGSELYLRYRLS